MHAEIKIVCHLLIWGAEVEKISFSFTHEISPIFCTIPKMFLFLNVGRGSKLALANSQNASDFDNLRVRKISSSKHL